MDEYEAAAMGAEALDLLMWWFTESAEMEVARDNVRKRRDMVGTRWDPEGWILALKQEMKAQRDDEFDGGLSK